MTAPPTVSIAIRAFRRRWLGEAIESVLAQTYRDLELVVYDDAGDLEDLVKRFRDPRVRYHRAQAKHGASGRYAAAVALCHGRCVGVLDDDDRYEPEFVERLVEALEADPRAGVAFCRVAYDMDGAVYVPRDERAPGRQTNVVRDLVAFRTFVQPSVMLIRREALADALRRAPMPDDVSPDAFVNVNASAAGWAHVLVDAPLVVRRWHPESMSHAGLDAARRTVATWESLARLDDELEPVRRSVLARKLVWLATYELAAGNRRAALAAVAAARRSDRVTWPVPRAVTRAAARVPVAGAVAARIALRLAPASGGSPPARAVREERSARRVGRATASVALGGAAAQVVVIAAAPLLTRVYTPAELGAASVLVGAMVAFGALACFRFDVAIPLARGRDEARALCALALGAAFAAAGLLAVASILVAPALLDFANAAAVAPWAWLLSAHAAIAGVGLTGAGLLIRRRRFGNLGAVRFAQAGMQSLVQVGAGAGGMGAPGFAVGATAGGAAYAIAAVAGVRRTARFAELGEAVRGIPTAARRWRSFAAWSALQAGLHLAALPLLPLLVAALYGPAAAGLFVLASRVLAPAVAVAGEAVGAASFATAAAVVREERGNVHEPLRLVTRSLLISGGAVLAIVLVAGPPLVPSLFGEAWRGAGNLLFALAPLYFFLFAAIPAGHTLQALGRTDILAAVAAARLAAGVAGIAGAHALGWPLIAGLGVYAAGMAAISVTIAVTAWRVSSRASPNGAASPR